MMVPGRQVLPQTQHARRLHSQRLLCRRIQIESCPCILLCEQICVVIYDEGFRPNVIIALEDFSEGLHKELLSEWNIKIITIQPGRVRTEWAKGSMVDRSLPPAYDTPDSPANKLREIVKNDTRTSDPINRAFLFVQHSLLVTGDHVVHSQPCTDQCFQGTQSSSQIASRS